MEGFVQKAPPVVGFPVRKLGEKGFRRAFGFEILFGNRFRFSRTPLRVDPSHVRERPRTIGRSQNFRQFGEMRASARESRLPRTRPGILAFLLRSGTRLQNRLARRVNRHERKTFHGSGQEDRENRIHDILRPFRPCREKPQVREVPRSGRRNAQAFGCLEVFGVGRNAGVDEENRVKNPCRSRGSEALRPIWRHRGRDAIPAFRPWGRKRSGYRIAGLPVRWRPPYGRASEPLHPEWCRNESNESIS